MKKFSPLALLALLLALPAAAEIPLESIRVASPAELRNLGTATPLEPHAAVDEGDRIITGSGGRISLQFAQQSMITLGENSELYIHSADPPDVGQGAVMRIQLPHGDLLVDARSTENVPPQDFRINIGSLSARVLGGHLWATADSEGETLCLLDGAAEINNGEDRHRLDGSNDCLGHRLDSNEVRIMTSTPEVMQPLLARTAFDMPKNIAMAALPQHLAMAASNRPRIAAAQPIAVQQPRPATPAPKAAAPAQPDGWTVVVASLSDAQAAEKMKNKLAREGLHAHLQISTADPTRQQVIIGSYKTQSDARKFAAKLKTQARFKGAWITPHMAEH